VENYCRADCLALLEFDEQGIDVAWLEVTNEEYSAPVT